MFNSDKASGDQTVERKSRMELLNSYIVISNKGNEQFECKASHCDLQCDNKYNIYITCHITVCQ